MKTRLSRSSQGTIKSQLKGGLGSLLEDQEMILTSVNRIARLLMKTAQTHLKPLQEVQPSKEEQVLTLTNVILTATLKTRMERTFLQSTQELQPSLVGQKKIFTLAIQLVPLTTKTEGMCSIL
jgi:hypothetical protein